ncbi:MAG: flagellar hook assembly protein FlgD [bacterium]
MLVDLINQFSADDLNQAAQKKETLGKDDFLRLLVTQLKNQDPLEPLKNEDFIAQLATFNSLEQMINLNKQFETMLLLQQVTQASALIGKEVTYYDAEGAAHEGTVDSVDLAGDVPQLNVGGVLIDITDVAAISAAS